ncbi:MAG: hypothetical protein ACREVK_12520 [Gammaproteobacteria bacterium]
MGDVAELVNTCRSRGIELFVRGGRLGARPKSLVDEELEGNISKHKPELLALLSQEAGGSAEIWAKAYTPKGELIHVRCESEEHRRRVEAANPKREAVGCGSALRNKVLKELADNPETKYAYVVDDPGTDPVIVGFGIRDTATCEIAIPKERFDPFEFLLAIKGMAGTT